MSNKQRLVAEIIELNGRRFESDDLRRSIARGELKTIDEVLEKLEEKNGYLMELIRFREKSIGEL